MEVYVVNLFVGVVSSLIAWRITAHFKDRKIKTLVKGFEIIGLTESLHDMESVVECSQKLSRQLKETKESLQETREKVASVQTVTSPTPQQIVEYSRAGEFITVKTNLGTVYGLADVQPCLDVLEEKISSDSEDSLATLINSVASEVSGVKSSLETAHKTLMKTIEKFDLK